MNDALVRIIKDRDYHLKQLEENIDKIQRAKEKIESLEKCNEVEQQLIEQYNQIIEIIEKA
jgi:hypothetical protein